MCYQKLVKSFLDWEIFQEAYQASLNIHNLTKSFKGSLEDRMTFIHDIRRCAQSVCANLAEGFAKQNYSQEEFKSFISKSIGAADEIVFRLMYAKDLDCMSQSDFDKYKGIYNRIALTLTSFYKNES